MEELKVFLRNSASEQFKESQKLTQAVETDSEKEPFKQKYQAREILHGLKCELCNLAEKNATFQFQFWISAVDCLLGAYLLSQFSSLQAMTQ